VEGMVLASFVSSVVGWRFGGVLWGTCVAATRVRRLQLHVFIGTLGRPPACAVQVAALVDLKWIGRSRVQTKSRAPGRGPDRRARKRGIIVSGKSPTDRLKALPQSLSETG